MRIVRLYRINKVLLEHGLDELIPAKWLPWYARAMRHTSFLGAKQAQGQVSRRAYYPCTTKPWACFY